MRFKLVFSPSCLRRELKSKSRNNPTEVILYHVILNYNVLAFIADPLTTLEIKHIYLNGNDFASAVLASKIYMTPNGSSFSIVTGCRRTGNSALYLAFC